MTREEAIKCLTSLVEVRRKYGDMQTMKDEIECLEMAIKALEQQSCENMGEVSDGYHTFNQLYHQRAILFATIVNQNVDKSWKSFKHEDGKYCFDRNGEWFIVGVDTHQGSYTYHYEKKYWNYFKCKELETAKHWDGHTEEDVTRLLSLEREPCEDCISRQATIDEIEYEFEMINSALGSMTLDFNARERLRQRRGEAREILNSIQQLPHVTPQPNMGRWIDEGFYAEGHSEHAYRCSECNEHYIGYVGEFKHCPNCGAIVKGEADGK